MAQRFEPWSAAWREHLAFEPEEARLLGLPADGTKDLGRRDELVARCADWQRSGSPGLQRRARLLLADARSGRDLLNLERSLFPVWSSTPDGPGYLAKLEEQMQAALASGLRPDRELARHFLDVEIPAIRDGASGALRIALERHEAFYREVLVPAGEDFVWRLGAEGYRERLAAYGDREPLRERAERVLEATHLRLVEFTGARSVAAALQIVRDDAVPRVREPVRAYGEANERLVDTVRAAGWFELPDDFQVPMRRLLPGMASVTHAGNVPAPLLAAALGTRDAEDAGGAFEVLEDPERHAEHWVAPLAAHEGVPGHYLQSWIWQQHFRKQALEDGVDPVDFVSIADVVAAERQDWGAMVAIEGWAVYAESLILRAGFHTRAGAAAALGFDAIRCVRALVDEGLHAGDLEDADAIELYCRNTALDESAARRELLRHKRVPTQPATYFVGWQRIEQRVAAAGGPTAETLRDVLLEGPVLGSR